LTEIYTDRKKKRFWDTSTNFTPENVVCLNVLTLDRLLDELG